MDLNSKRGLTPLILLLGNKGRYGITLIVNNWLFGIFATQLIKVNSRVLHLLPDAVFSYHHAPPPHVLERSTCPLKRVTEQS